MGGTVEAVETRNALTVAAVGQVSARVFELMLPTIAVVISSQTVAPIRHTIEWMAIAYALYGLGALPGALIADRVSARVTIIVGVFGCGVAALAAGEAPNGRVLSYCLGIMGLSASVCRPAGVALLHRTASDWRRALRVAVWAGRVAMVLTPALIAVVGARFGWHPTLRCVGYVLCALAVTASFLPVHERAAAGRRAPPLSPRAARFGLAPWPVFAAAALAAIAALGVTLITPWYVSTRVTSVAYGPATSAVLAIGLLGAVALGRIEPSVGRRAHLLLHAMAIVALVLMIVCTESALLLAVAMWTACSLATRAIDERMLAHLWAHRAPAMQAAMPSAWMGTVAALAVPLMAHSVRTGERPGLLWLIAAELLAVLVLALVISRRAATSESELTVAAPAGEDAYLLLPRGSRTGPP
jgi:MFS family permease